MGNESRAWVDEEFESLDLGDPRRDRRAKELHCPTKPSGASYAVTPDRELLGVIDAWMWAREP